jgi:SPP1 family phage portal protein
MTDIIGHKHMFGGGAMPTPEELVQMTLKEWIYKEDHINRISNYQLLESYYDGTFADDDMIKLLRLETNPNKIVSPRVREALGSDFKVIANYAKTVVNKAVGYLCSKPISIEVKPDLYGMDGDDEDTKKRREQAKAFAKEGERLLYNVYRDNHFLQKNIIKLIRLQGKKGDVFVKCWMDPNDKDHPIKMTVLRPDYVYIKFRSDDYEDWEYVAIIYNKMDEQGNPYKFAQVWWSDIWREYELHKGETSWTVTTEEKNPIGMIPIVHIKNMEDEKPWGESDIECIRTLIDAICKAFTDLMCNADYQAFQRLIVSGYERPPKTPGQPEKKEDTGPGTMLCIPGDGAGTNPEVTIVEPADPQGLINIIKTIREEISAHGRVPQIALSQADGAGAASSLSLRIHYQPLDEKCNEKATLAGAGLQQINKIIFAYHKLLKREDFTQLKTEIHFSKSLPVDRKEESDIRHTEIADKIKSRKTAMEEAGVDDTDAEMEEIRKEQQEAQEDIYSQRLTQELEEIAKGQSRGAEEK